MRLMNDEADADADGDRQQRSERCVSGARRDAPETTSVPPRALPRRRVERGRALWLRAPEPGNGTRANYALLLTALVVDVAPVTGAVGCADAGSSMLPMAGRSSRPASAFLRLSVAAPP